MTFDVKLPSGKTLTQYKTGPGPHTGVHLIIVRDDLAYIIHEHPPIPPSGIAAPVGDVPRPRALPRARRRLPRHPRRPAELPAVSQRHRDRRVSPDQAAAVRGPPGRSTASTSTCSPTPRIHAIQAAFLHVNVTDAHSKPVHFVPWFGALAHAIFFRQGTLNYFHTHVCAPDAPDCGSLARRAGRKSPAARRAGQAHARRPAARRRAPGGCSCSSRSTDAWSPRRSRSTCASETHGSLEPRLRGRRYARRVLKTSRRRSAGSHAPWPHVKNKRKPLGSGGSQRSRPAPSAPVAIAACACWAGPSSARSSSWWWPSSSPRAAAARRSSRPTAPRPSRPRSRSTRCWRASRSRATRWDRPAPR